VWNEADDKWTVGSETFVAGTFEGALSGAVTGNATTATTLQTARTIGGVSFNGSSNINLPGVNTAGNQNTSGNAATSTALATSRTISLTGDVSGSASFNGTANATITATIADDSHNHVISNVDGLQTALDSKYVASTQATATWESGTSTTESLVSPAKVKAAVEANQPTSLGAVGTYALLVRDTGGSTISEGTTYAGSGLRYTGFRVGIGAFYEAFCAGATGGTPSGTWRAMGTSNNNSAINPANLFLRIS
jgi:hypothetical protein